MVARVPGVPHDKFRVRNPRRFGTRRSSNAISRWPVEVRVSTPIVSMVGVQAAVAKQRHGLGTFDQTDRAVGEVHE